MKRDLQTRKTMWDPLHSRMLSTDPHFKIANDGSGKVRCTICPTHGGHESWINNSSANAHLKNQRHGRSVATEQRQADEAASDSSQWMKIAAETERQLKEDFVPQDAVPSAQVTSNKPIPLRS